MKTRRVKVTLTIETEQTLDEVLGSIIKFGETQPWDFVTESEEVASPLEEAFEIVEWGFSGKSSEKSWEYHKKYTLALKTVAEYAREKFKEENQK